MRENTTVPHEQSERTAEHQQEYSFLDVGIVTSAPEQNTDGAHHITVGETRTPSDQPIPVIPGVHGDYYVPPEGMPVLVAYVGENDAVAIGSPLPPTDTETVTAGERILSHPLSQAAVQMLADGTLRLRGADGTDLTVEPDGTIVVDGGTQGAVTDVSIASTNSNGGATSLSVERNEDILL